MAGTLYAVAGKIAAGKSTRVAALGEETGGLVLGEDFWLATLYPGQITSLEDYLRDSGRLRTAMAPLIVDLLRRGNAVVLDFPANTLASRAWMRGLAEQAGVETVIHFLDVPDAVCLERLHARNAAGTHEYAPTDEEFALFTSHFVPPTEGEGFTVVRFGVE